MLRSVALRWTKAWQVPRRRAAPRTLPPDRARSQAPRGDSARLGTYRARAAPATPGRSGAGSLPRKTALRCPARARARRQIDVNAPSMSPAAILIWPTKAVSMGSWYFAVGVALITASACSERRSPSLNIAVEGAYPAVAQCERLQVRPQLELLADLDALADAFGRQARLVQHDA